MMDTKTAVLRSGGEERMEEKTITLQLRELTWENVALTYCEKWIQIYEQKIRRYKLASLTKRLRAAARSHFKEREQTVLARLQWAWPQKMEARRTTTRADWIVMHIFDFDEEEALLQSILHTFYMDSGEEGAAFAARMLSKQIGREVIYRGSREWIQDNAIKFGKKYANLVSKTTNQAIRDQIAGAIKEGEGLDETMKRIANVYSDAEGYRSEMIARTEMGRSYQMGSVGQDKAFGITLWDMEGCDPDCPICGPFMGGNPHTYGEISAFEAEVHPNHVGVAIGRVPDNFEPNLT